MRHQKKPDPKSKAAIQSFANAGGGANHMLDPDRADEDSMSDDDSIEMIEFEPDTTWFTDNSCQRWIVQDGLKQKNGN